MKEFFEWTAWHMECPKSYGAFHILFFLIGLAVVIGLAYLLRKANDKQNKIILFVVSGVLMVFELYKQLFYYYVVGNGSYQWWIFPFQLCSAPMYLCLVAAILKPGKIQNAILNFMLAFNLMGGFIAFLEPSGLTHEYWTLTIHAFVWHLLIVFVGLYLGLSGRAGKRLKDYRGATIVFGILCVIAFIINVSLWKVSNHSVNMFFVGPVNSPLAVFKQISESIGWYFNTLIYIPCLCLAAFLFFMPFCLVYKHHHKEITA